MRRIVPEPGHLHQGDRPDPGSRRIPRPEEGIGLQSDADVDDGAQASGAGENEQDA